MTLSVVHAQGSNRAMGRTYGEAFASGIREALHFYDRALGRSATVGDLSPHIDAARAAAPLIAEEIEGIAEGAGISLEEAWWLNCIEEVSDIEACTTMVVGRWLLHAEQWYAGHAAVGVVIAHPDSGPEFVSPTCAGFLPAVGFNSSGFAQGIDSLTASDERTGVPRVVVSRLALGARGIQGAITNACIPGRAGGYAHTLVSGTDSVVVETSASTEHVIRGHRAHTNHYLAAPPPGTPPPSRGSRARLSRAIELLGDAPPADIEHCTALLADHDGEPEAICLHEQGDAASATVFGMVCDVVSGQVIVSDGPPCRGVWEEFSLAPSEAGLVG